MREKLYLSLALLTLVTINSSYAAETTQSIDVPPALALDTVAPATASLAPVASTAQAPKEEFSNSMSEYFKRLEVSAEKTGLKTLDRVKTMVVTAENTITSFEDKAGTMLESAGESWMAFSDACDYRAEMFCRRLEGRSEEYLQGRKGDKARTKKRNAEREVKRVAIEAEFLLESTPDASSESDF